MVDDGPVLEDRTIPLRGMRGMIADKLVESLATAAQLTHHATADATSLLRRKLEMEREGTKVSIEDLLLHCVVRVIARHPEINGRVEGREIRLSRSIDLGVAIALPGNLLVAPAIFDCAGRSAGDLRTARRDLAERARTNKLSVTETTAGTFTVSNLGLTRVEQFTPILNAPQIAILGVGRIAPRAAAGEDGTVVLRPHVGLSLTFDHRAIDGLPAAEALSDLCEIVEAL